MSINKVPDKEGGVYIIISHSTSGKRVQFSEFKRRIFVDSRTVLYSEILQRDPVLVNFPRGLMQIAASKKAESEWTKFEKTMRLVEFPNALKWVLKTPKKKQQTQQLKKCSFNLEQFHSFLFFTENEGYTFCQYIAKYHHAGLDENDLPEIINGDKNPVRIVGETPLTNGQLQKVISDRSVVVSTFIDKGDEWHCFFATYESLKGEENWQNGTPHFHYLSDKFGISRDEAVRQLTSRKYQLGSLPHIEILDYKTIREEE